MISAWPCTLRGSPSTRTGCCAVRTDATCCQGTVTVPK